MTTYIIDDTAAGCDSMWSYPDGSRCDDLSLNKYLYVNSTLDDIDIQPCLILYSGDYEQLVLHQAYRLEQIDIDQYETYLNAFIALGRASLSYVEIALVDWSIASFYNETRDSGLLFSGTGGPIAFDHYYNKSNYCIRRAVDFAIEQDPRSGYEINYMVKSPRCLPSHVENFVEVDENIYNSIYDHLYEILRQLDSQRGSNTMKNMTFAGCTTALGSEAPSISTPSLIEIEKKRKAISTNNPNSVGSVCMLNKKQIKKKKIVPMHGNTHTLMGR